MAAARNRLMPIKSHIRSQQNSRQKSAQELPLHQSLHKTVKQNAFNNPYLKKFNLRKINKTEVSVNKQSLRHQQSNQKEQFCQQIQAKLNESLKPKGDKRSNIRIHTQKIRNRTTEVLKDSPYKAKIHIQRHSNHNSPTNKAVSSQKSNNIYSIFRKTNNLYQSSKNSTNELSATAKPQLQTIDHQRIQTYSKYQHLTQFQQQQIHRYEMYFIGKRRVHSIKDWTDRNNDAKVAAHDAIIYRYQILDILGKGSFGQVFKAYDHKKKQVCAIKIIRNQPKFSTQAKVQIKILQHTLIKDTKMRSNIIQIKHAFFFRGHACLVFQLLHQNLYEFLRQFKFSGLSLDLILRFVIQILQCLQFLRKYSIIHCDLKPQNILLKHKNKTGIKIIDLGSGCFEQQQIYTYIQSRFYRAPQIIFGIPYTCAIDVWSLGCIIVQLFKGVPLFPGEDQYQQIAMMMEVLGVPPPELIQKGSRTKKFFTNFIPKVKPNKKGHIRKPRSKNLSQVLNCNNEQFIDFVGKCLIWQPQKRISPTQALLHPWILNSVPTQMRKQHIQQTQKNFNQC